MPYPILGDMPSPSRARVAIVALARRHAKDVPASVIFTNAMNAIRNATASAGMHALGLVLVWDTRPHTSDLIPTRR